MIQLSNKLLINYSGCENYLINKVSSFCLTPLVTAFGKKVTYHRLNANPTKLTSTETKTSSLALRFLSAGAALVLFPLTLIGVLLRLFSPSYPCRIKTRSQLLYLHLIEDKTNEVVKKLNKNSNYYLNNQINQQQIQQVTNQLLELATLLYEKASFEKPTHPSPFFFNLYQKKLEELKPVIQESIEESSKRLLFEENNNRFKKDVCLHLLSLKKSLRLMIENYKEGPSSLLQQITKDYLFIREAYYKQFLARHFVYNLDKKKRIPALKLTRETVLGSFEKDELNDVLVDIQKIFDQKINNFLDIQFFFKVSSFKLVSLAQDSKELEKVKSAEKSINDPFFASHEKEKEKLFELDQSSYFSFFDCLNSLFNDLREESSDFLCLKDPKLVIEDFSNLFKKWIEETKNKGQIPLNLFDQNPSRENLKRYLKILWTLKPDDFKEAILPLIESFQTSLNELKIKQEEGDLHKKIVELSQWIDSIKDLEDILPVYDSEDRLFLCQQEYPLILGLDQTKKEKKVLQHPLKLGKQISFLFVPRNRLEQIKSYLKNKKVERIEEIKIYSFDMLKIMHYLFQLKVYKEKDKDLTKAYLLKPKKESLF